MQTHDYEGLQVDHSNQGPEVVRPDQPGLEPVRHGNGVLKDVDASEANGEYGEYQDREKSGGRRYCCGLSRRAFWVLAAVIIVLVVGAVVGGSVGGVMSNKHTSSASSASSTSSSSSTSAKSSTTSSSSPLPTSGILALDCPNINGTQYVSKPGSSEHTFYVNCKVNFAGHQTGISLQGSINSCLDQCAKLQDKKTGSCLGATWDANLTRFDTKEFGFANCFLFDRIDSQAPYTTDNVQASGSLVS